MLPSQRELFEMPRQICYLNSASYSPLPLETQQAGRAAVGRKGTPWTLDAAFANTQHDRARAAAARLINADPADIALIPSISYGVATAAKLVAIARGSSRHRSGERSFLAGAGMADQGRGAGFYRRDDRASPATATGPRRFCGDRAAGRAAGRPCLDLFGALVGRRVDRPRTGGCGAASGKARSFLSTRRKAPAC